jgi:hypothetical protein
MSKKDLEQLDYWRERLWKMVKQAAEGKKGLSVIKALRRANRKLNKLGMDKMYDRIADADSTDGLYYAFDITWLAAFALELQRLPQSK